MAKQDSRELRIRKLLNDKISRKLKLFRDKAYSVYGNPDDCNIIVSNLYDKFVESSGSHFGDTITRIRNHQDYQRQGKYAVYNYFDIDSLYAFDVYLDKLLQLVASGREMVRGYKYPRITERTLAKAMQGIVDWSVRFKNQEESKYYKGYATLALVYRNGSRELDPITTGVSKTLAEKMTPQEIDEELNKYFDELHMPVDTKVKENDKNSDNGDVDVDPYEYIDYTYYGEKGNRHFKLRVTSDEWFHDENGVLGIRSIVASGADGTLFATYRCDDGNLENRHVYTGLVYDEEYNPVDEITEGESFVPSKSLRALYGAVKEKTFVKPISKSGTKKPRPKVLNPDQRTLFDASEDYNDGM